MWSRWRNGWVIMTSGPEGATDERQRKMVYTKQETTVERCWRAA